MNDDRSTYIGGPGAATILGVNPWQTPLALWQELTGRAERTPTTEVMRSGQRLEPVVLAFAGEQLGVEVKPGPFVRHPTLPLGGHIDGEISDEQGVEGKTTRVRTGWGEPGTGEVPPHVAAQAMHYMGLRGYGVMWVPVLFSGLEFALYRVARDETLIRQMADLCCEWWSKYVETDTPPPPQTGADAARLWPKDSGKVVIADDATVAAVSRLHQVRHSLSTLEEEKDALEDRVKLALGDAATLMIGDQVAATWKATKPTMRFDSAAFKAAQPEVYQSFCRPVESRRFLLK